MFGIALVRSQTLTTPESSETHCFPWSGQRQGLDPHEVSKQFQMQFCEFCGHRTVIRAKMFGVYFSICHPLTAQNTDAHANA
jgi:hypothetical protein